jgi:hypothetical protein
MYLQNVGRLSAGYMALNSETQNSYRDMYLQNVCGVSAGYVA